MCVATNNPSNNSAIIDQQKKLQKPLRPKLYLKLVISYNVFNSTTKRLKSQRARCGGPCVAKWLRYRTPSTLKPPPLHFWILHYFP